MNQYDNVIGYIEYLIIAEKPELGRAIAKAIDGPSKEVRGVIVHRHVLGQAIRIRSPYVDALSVTQVLALGSLRKRVDKEELTHGQKENYTYLILCTVSGVAAGLQNTG